MKNLTLIVILGSLLSFQIAPSNNIIDFAIRQSEDFKIEQIFKSVNFVKSVENQRLHERKFEVA